MIDRCLCTNNWAIQAKLAVFQCSLKRQDDWQALPKDLLDEQRNQTAQARQMPGLQGIYNPRLLAMYQYAIV